MSSLLDFFLQLDHVYNVTEIIFLDPLNKKWIGSP